MGGQHGLLQRPIVCGAPRQLVVVATSRMDKMLCLLDRPTSARRGRQITLTLHSRTY